MSAEESADSKYELRECIGKGAFGEVNLVVEKHTKQRYVLKRIKMARQSEWQRKATRQEIEIVSRLRHPFIMPYKEHWTHHGHTINVVYGYCEKGDLTIAITKQKNKYFPEETLRLWLAELLLAIDYMHKQHVLHRDIKTQNILLTGDGDVQIGDFGLSTMRVHSSSDIVQQRKQQPGGDDADTAMASDKLPVEGGAAATPEPAKAHHAHATAYVQANHAGAEAYTHGLANAHANGHNGHNHGDKDKDQLAVHTPLNDKGTRNDYALVGTPHFMSPELLSSQKYSYETDIWSLGVVMYELTTLKPPFNAFNLAGLVAKIKKAALPPIPPCYSADWTTILKSMLKKDPTRRASPLELLAVPSMQQALQQAHQRAMAISPNFVLPDIPVLNTGVSPGFCFDVTMAGAAAGTALAGQVTPSAAGPSTPVLVHPNTGLPDDPGGTSGTEAEPSPLSKFPDLGSAESSLPVVPLHVVTTTATDSGAAPVAAMKTTPTTGPANHAKAPATARRAGTTGGAHPIGSATAAGKRAVSPQRTRAPPVFGAGMPRSKTPCRGAAAMNKAEGGEPNPRMGGKGAIHREQRSKSVVPVNGRASPGEFSEGAVLAADETMPVTARTGSPTESAERPTGRKAGPSSGPAPRVPGLAGGFRLPSGKRSVLDAVVQPSGVMAPPVSTAPASLLPETENDTVSVSLRVPANAPAGTAAANRGPSPRGSTAGSKAPEISNKAPPHSSATGPKSASPGAGTSGVAPPAAAAAAGGGGHGNGNGSSTSRSVPWRNTRPASLNTVRTSRAALAAVSSSPQVSPRGDDAAASGDNTATSKRLVSVARGGSADVTTSAAAMIASSNSKRGGASAADSVLAGVKRSGPGEAGAAAPNTARQRGTAGGAATPTYRRSHAGLPTTAKDTNDASSSRQPEKRIRRSSFVAYGKPAESSVQQRRQAGGVAPTLTTKEPSATSPTAAAAAAAATVVSVLTSHSLLGASDPALENGPCSSSCSPPDAPTVAHELPNDGGVAVGSARGEEQSSPSCSGDAAAGAGDPGTGAASRSLRSMTTEDSELSLPDGSRYGPLEPGHGSLYDIDEAAGPAGGFREAALRACENVGTASGTAAGGGGGLPLWSSNQLFSGSYGSLANSLVDVGGTNGSAGGAPPPQSGNVSARPSEAVAPLGATATLAADLPRRVSASAFTPHLLNGCVTAAGAGAADDASGTESGTSSSSGLTRGTVRSNLRRLTLNDSLAAEESLGGGGGMQLVSPGRFDLVSAEVAAGSPGALSSATESPASTRYPSDSDGAAYGLELVSPTAAATQPAQQQFRRQTAQASSDSPVGQPRRNNMPSQKPQQQQGSRRALEPRGRSATGNNVCHQYASSRLGGEAASNHSYPPGSSAQRGMSHLQTQQSVDGLGSPVDSSSEVTSQLRPAMSAHEDETGMPGEHLGGSVPRTGSELSTSEQAQLVLLQRVVSLAASLWEMGRDEELGAVLSSTMSRALVRRVAHVEALGQPGGSELLQQQRAKSPELGSIVRVTGGSLRDTEGVVRYRGPSHWGAGTVLGLEIHGTVAASRVAPSEASAPPGWRDGVRYFRCHQTGSVAAFVPVDQVVLLDQCL